MHLAALKNGDGQRSPDIEHAVRGELRELSRPARNRRSGTMKADIPGSRGLARIFRGAHILASAALKSEREAQCACFSAASNGRSGERLVGRFIGQFELLAGSQARSHAQAPASEWQSRFSPGSIAAGVFSFLLALATHR